MANNARAQYRRKVPESFPDRISLVDKIKLETSIVAALREKLASTGTVLADHFLEAAARSAIDAGTLVDYKKGGSSDIQLRYGLNPGQPAAFYEEEGASGPNIGNIEVLQEGGKGLGYINVGDTDLGIAVVRRMSHLYPDDLHCVIMKHEIPSAFAKGKDPDETYELAWQGDSLSNFGGVTVCSYEITVVMAAALADKVRNAEVIVAPGYTDHAMERLRTRKDLRIVRVPSFREESHSLGWLVRSLTGGLLVQNEPYSKIDSPEDLTCVSKTQPTPEQLRAAVLQWNLAYFVRSNAVVIGDENKSHGIGAGQQSRIDAAEIAITKSRRGYGPVNTVMASDAFMPQTDVVEAARLTGVRAIVYPLGSVKDGEIIEAADKIGIVLLATRRPGETDCERGFYHR
ncbi:MAG: hypothetical protein AABX70_03130 [Nanoarchaeota archaeon]